MPINQEDFILRFKADTSAASQALAAFIKQAQEAEAALAKFSGASGAGGAGGKLFGPLGQEIKSASEAEKQLKTAVESTTASMGKQAKSADTAAAAWQTAANKIKASLLSVQQGIEGRQFLGLGPTETQLSKLNVLGQRGLSLAANPVAGVTAAETEALRVNSQAIVDNSTKVLADVRAKQALVIAERESAAATAAAAKAAAAQAAQIKVEDAAINRLVLDLQRQQRILQQTQQFRQKQTIAPVNAALATAQELQTATSGIERFRKENIFASQAVADLTTKQTQLKPKVDAATASFSRHALTIAQGLVVYNAFGVALQGVRDAIQIVIDIGIETTRLGLVLGGLSKTDATKFLDQLGQTAVQTNTSFVDLVANTDLVAGALAGFGKQDTQSRLQLINDFQRIAGEFSNVVGIGADLGIVDKQLVDLFNIFKGSFSGIEDFRNLLDEIVVLNHYNATGIQITTDALESAGLAASRAGFSAELLTSIFAKLAFSTQKSGTEIGGLFTTVLSKLQDPAILGKLQSLTEGVVQFTDSAGNLKQADEILASIAINQKEISALGPGRLAEVIKQLGQQIQPGAAAFNEKVLQATLKSVDELALHQVNYTDALKKTNQALSETLSFKFGAFIQRLTVGIQAFQEQLGNVLSSVLGFGNKVIDVLQGLGPGFGVVATSAIALLTAIGLLNSVGGKLISFLFAWSAGTKQAYTEAYAAAVATKTQAAAEVEATVATEGLAVAEAELAVAGEGVAVAEGEAALATGLAGSAFSVAAAKAGVFAAAGRLAVGAFSALWPVLALIAGIEIGGALATSAEQISAMVDGLSFIEDDAQKLVHAGEPLGPDPHGRPRTGREPLKLPTGDTIAAPVTDKEVATIKAYNEAIAEIVKSGAAVGESQTSISDKVARVTDALLDNSHGYETDANSAQFFINAANATVGSADQVKEKIGKLYDQFIAGSISHEEYAKSLAELNQEMAAANLADAKNAYANDNSASSLERLNQARLAYIQTLGDSASATDAQTQEQIIETQTNFLLANSAEAVGKAIQDLSQQYIKGKITLDEYNSGLSNIDQAHEDAARLVAVYQDRLREAIPALRGAAEGNDALTIALFNMLNQADLSGPLQTLIDNLLKVGVAGATTADLVSNAINIIVSSTQIAAKSFAAIREGSTATYTYSVTALHNQALALVNEAQRDLAALGSAILGSSRSVASGGSSGGSSSGASQPNILDIGDLSASDISKIVSIATALRNAIPGETAADKDSVVSLIKDASFLQTVKGIDDRLLRIALEELTQQMEEANRLKQKENVLQNLVVSAGPLSGLISQPTTFGVGGSFASGTGLNFDPTKGNFTINVPVELKGLDPANLQQQIYNIIYKAIQDALRL